MDRRYSIIEHFNDKLLSRTNGNVDTLRLEEMPADQIVRHLCKEASPDQPIPDLLDCIYSRLENQKEYRHALSLNTVIQAVKQYITIYYHETERSIDGSLFESFELEEMARTTLERIRETILRGYERRKVYTSDEIEKHEHAIEAYLRDIKENHERRFFDYFHEQFPSVSYDEYRRKERVRFEYLMKTARDNFFEMCRERLSA
ncbi:MAG: hypothetical protein QHI48_03980 [Bacteroidota bacterium]|nr:hypothetical protein [Bacteroidota bacterium]